MIDRRKRLLLYGGAGLLVVWLMAVGGYAYFSHKKVTAEKVAAYLREVDLDRLSGAARAKAIAELVEKMNALTGEERRRARLEAEFERWFLAMTEQEKAGFIEATLPSGIKQMLSSFEQLPVEKRRRAVDQALRNLQRARRELEAGAPGSGEWEGGTNRAVELSPELREKLVTVGLKSFYSESSAQTKAELAPVLEEMQRLMERGGMFMDHRH